MSEQFELTAFVLVIAITAFGSGMFLAMGRGRDSRELLAVSALFIVIVIAGIWL